MEENSNYTNGTNVPMIEVPVEGNNQIVPVNTEDEYAEITPGQVALGGALGFALSVGIWEGLKWLFRKVVEPAAIKVADKARERRAKEENADPVATAPAAMNTEIQQETAGDEGPSALQRAHARLLNNKNRKK